MKTSYTPSRLLTGDTEMVRRHSFTRWMSGDLLRPASGFLRNLGLLAIYAESSAENKHRYLCWHPPEGCAFEVRSGRTFEQFERFDRANIERGWSLLTLHVNECDIYSAVWISTNNFEVAEKVLAVYGITPASRPAAA